MYDPSMADSSNTVGPSFYIYQSHSPPLQKYCILLDMSEVVHADIFFFITSMVVVLLGAVLVVALVYVVFIVRDVRAIVARVRRASESLEGDLDALRSQVKQEGYKARAMVDLLLGFVGRKISKAVKPKRARRVMEEESTDEQQEN